MAGFGGGVLLLPVFTAMFGLRTAVPMLTLTQLSSNGSRMRLNRRALHWPMIGWFALGTVPSSVAGGLLLTRAPLAPLQRLLGVFLIAVVVWRRLRPTPRQPATTAFAGIGAASGFGSALLGSVGPLTAPFFLAARLTRGAYIGTEAASALTMHLTKVAAYGTGQLLPVRSCSTAWPSPRPPCSARGSARTPSTAPATGCSSCSSRPAWSSPGSCSSSASEPAARHSTMSAMDWSWGTLAVDIIGGGLLLWLARIAALWFNRPDDLRIRDALSSIRGPAGRWAFGVLWRRLSTCGRAVPLGCPAFPRGFSGRAVAAGGCGSDHDRRPRASPKTPHRMRSQSRAQGQCSGRCSSRRRARDPGGHVDDPAAQGAPRAVAGLPSLRVAAARNMLWVIAAQIVQALLVLAATLGEDVGVVVGADGAVIGLTA